MNLSILRRTIARILWAVLYLWRLLIVPMCDYAYNIGRSQYNKTAQSYRTFMFKQSAQPRHLFWYRYRLGFAFLWLFVTGSFYYIIMVVRSVASSVGVFTSTIPLEHYTCIVEKRSRTPFFVHFRDCRSECSELLWTLVVFRLNITDPLYK